MAINIQNIVDAVQAKINSADSDQSTAELGRLAQANRILGELQNNARYRAGTKIPTATRFNQGRMIFDSEQNEYLLSYNYRWNILDLEDSAAVNQTPNVGSTTGFIVGGRAGSTASDVVDGFPFASDGDAAVSLTTLNTARYQLHAGNDATTCVNVGGTTTGSETDTVEQFPFSSPSVSVNLSGLGNSRVRGISNHTVGGAKGYMSGGLTFPNAVTSDSRSFNIVTSGGISGTSIGSLTAGARVGGAGFQSGETAYLGGGYTTPPFSSLNSIEKFPFATETLTSISPGTLASQPFNDAAAIYDNSKGIIQSANNLDEIPFAAETASALGPSIPSPSIRGSASSQPVAGYFTAFQAPSPSSSIGTRYKVPFASGVATTPGGGLSVTRGWAVGQHV